MTATPLRRALAILAATLLPLAGPTAPARGWQPDDQQVAAGRRPLALRSAELTESSGLAFSQRDPSRFWTHNDSGGRPRLLAFDPRGMPSGAVELTDASAADWEDVASFVDGGPRLLVADVGDNDARRGSVSLYLFDEPDPNRHSQLRRYQHLRVRYAEGPTNCESVTVDVANRRILLLSKSALVASLYAVDLPPPPDPRSDSARHPGAVRHELTARRIARVAIPLATGMDLCPRTGDLWVATYLHAYRYAAAPDQSLAERLRRVPEMVPLPKLKQIEAIAVDEGGTVWITSEGRPALMQRVRPGVSSSVDRGPAAD